MFMTIFDISNRSVLADNWPAFIGAIGAIVIGTSGLIGWIKFRYFIMGPKTTMYLGQVTLNEAEAVAYNAYRAKIRNGGTIILSLICAITWVIGLLILIGTYTLNAKYRGILESNSVKIVEGTINQFKPYGTSDQHIRDFPHLKTESFRVGDTLFFYSRDYRDSGFRDVEGTSPMLADGKTAKVWYTDDPETTRGRLIILKLEIQ